jgi:hypothetical protein
LFVAFITNPNNPTLNECHFIDLSKFIENLNPAIEAYRLQLSQNIVHELSINIVIPSEELSECQIILNCKYGRVKGLLLYSEKGSKGL